MRIGALTIALAIAAGAAYANDIPFVVDETPGFRPVLPALRAYLATQSHLPSGIQHFCVLGYDRNGQKTAWVYWREGQRLIYWEPAAAGFEPKDTLIRSRRDLDLKRDVVATPREVHASSFRIDRPWLDRLLTDCRRRGRQYELP